MLPERIMSADSGYWADAKVCRQMLPALVADRQRHWQGMAKRLSGPPHSSQVGNKANIAYCLEQSKLLGARRAGISPHVERRLYTDAIERSPGDPLLHTRFAQYLERNGALDESLAEYREVCRLVPEYPLARFNYGVTLYNLKHYEEARRSLAWALELHPDFKKARDALEFVRRNHPELFD
jgi:tetratricopeptide (TPR) repeat protein